MRKKAEVYEKINSVLLDARYWYKAATLDINPILALVQVDFEARLQSYCWMINKSVADIKKEFIEGGRIAL